MINKSGILVKKTINSVATPIQKFMHLEASSGMMLLCVTSVALLLANLGTASWYFDFINTPVFITVGGFELKKTLLLLVNDGLMAIFFYLVGLEIKREIMVGELSTPKKASFSIFAAIGGMVFPALFYYIFNKESGYVAGWGIPMATDIAFAVGILTLLGNRVPPPLKVFLLALAIVDDLGAILVIALFYTSKISTNFLGFSGIFMFLLFLLNYAGIRNLVIGIILGTLTWFCFLKSGIHATIAGVFLAFLTPARSITSNDESETPRLLIDNYIYSLHPWVAFVIMPIFAFFNAGVSLGVGTEVLMNPVIIGISFGLLLGKPIGISIATFIAVKTQVATLPKGVTWPQIISVGFLAGIGFTMSLFIGSLAFKGQEIESYAKIGILIASGLAMLIGLVSLKLTISKKEAITS